MSHIVKLPPAAEQFKKTPRRVRKTLISPEGEPYEVEVLATVGEGEAATVDRYGDVLSRSKADPRANKDALPTLERHLAAKGEWGVGCPAGCGRFWALKVGDDGAFTPADSAAYAPVEGVYEDKPEPFPDEDDREEEKPPTEVKTRNGYLDWRPQPDGSILLVCDRCGAEIRLDP